MSKRKCSKLWLYFAGLVFATVFIVFIIVCGIWFLLFELDILSANPLDRHMPILVFCLGSILLGAIIALFVGKVIIRPIQNISNAFDELSNGNFAVRVPEDEKIADIREMAQRFNAMVFDLSHVETLQQRFCGECIP